MIRLRIGQHWKREPAGIPLDSVSLQVEGVELLPGASEEHLVATVPALVDAVHALVVSGHRQAQVSCSIAHLELLLTHEGDMIALEVVRLARPARLLRPALHLPTDALAAAVAEGAEAFQTLLLEERPELARTSEAKKMGRQLRALAGDRRKRVSARSPRQGPTLELPVSAHPGFAVTLRDTTGRLSTWRKGSKAPLFPLLVEGELSLRLAGREGPVWTATGIPFLHALELAREADDLLRAVEPELALGAASEHPLRWDTARHQLTSGAGAPPIDLAPEALAGALFTVGQELVVRLVERYPSLASNPYVRELSIRCVAGLAQLKDARPDAVRPPAAAPSPPIPTPTALQAAEDASMSGDPGQLRAVRFVPRLRWTTEGEAPIRILLREAGPLLAGPHRLVQLDAEGRELASLEGELGVAALEDGRALVADGPYVQLRSIDSEAARWFHSHDGLPLGPELWALDGKLLTLSEERTLLAYNTVTGRELWRMAIPKTVRVHTAVAGELVVLTTDSGVLLGLDAEDGQRRFQLRSRMGFPGPARVHDGALLITLHAGSEAAVVAADAQSGAIAWMKEGLGLEHPTVPATDGVQVFLAGRRDGEPRVVALGGGEVRFDRPVPLGPPPYALQPYGDGVIAMSSDGTAARLSADGTVRWRAGSPGEPQPRALAPILRGALVVLPGRTVRLVEAEGGRPLGELSTEAPLVDVALSDALTLYLLDEEGTLTGHQLLSHLTLLESSG